MANDSAPRIIAPRQCRKQGPHFCRVFIAAVLTGLLAAVSQAAPPANRPAAPSTVDVAPAEMYPISEQNGPWMIMAATFSGETQEERERAQEQASALVHELRTRFKMPAYSYRKKFDFSQGVASNRIDRYGAPRTMRYQRHDDLVEIGVLVGDFPTYGDAEGQRLLRKIKYAEPECLKVKDGQATSQSLAAVRMMQREVQQHLLPADSELLKKGPMGQAFVVTNPLLPPEYFAPKGVDKLVIKMNKGVKHSLLDCPKRYTVKVATFTGHSILLDRKNADAIERGAVPKSYLESAANNSQILTEALRKKGYEAYEFHDRGASIVTVGSFDSVGSPRADGKIEINPGIHTIMTTFGAETKVVPGSAAPEVGKPKKLAGVPFDVQPVPVEVPRHLISADYAASADR